MKLASLFRREPAPVQTYDLMVLSCARRMSSSKP